MAQQLSKIDGESGSEKAVSPRVEAGACPPPPRGPRGTPEGAMDKNFVYSL